MIDLLTHAAWISVVVLSWSWAIAQAVYAIRDVQEFGWARVPVPRSAPWWVRRTTWLDWGPWRVKVTVWLTAKAMLFTAIAVWAWDDMAARPYEWAVWLFALTHAWVFAAWLRLPPNDAPQPTERPP